MIKPGTLEVNLANRKWLATRLRAEIVGPDPVSTGIVFNPPIQVTWEEFRKPKKQANGEEVIWQDPPAKRYGAGILFPMGVIGEQEEVRSGEDLQDITDIDQDEGQGADEKLEERAEKKAANRPVALEESEDYAVTLSNAFKPSAMGLSFLADFSLEIAGFRAEVVNVGRFGSEAIQEGPAGRYKKVKVMVGELGSTPISRDIWLRIPLQGIDGKYPFIEFTSTELLQSTKQIIRSLPSDPDLEMVVVSRSYPHLKSSQRLITVSLVNRKQQSAGGIDEQCLFQAGIRIRGLSDSPWIRPYSEQQISKLEVPTPLSDEMINRLLYRQHQTFAIGHGCAADWAGESPSLVGEVWTDVMPAYETPSTSADLFVQGFDGSMKPIKVSMRKIAALDPADDGSSEIAALVEAYKQWIEALKSDRSGIPPVGDELSATAKGLVSRCEECLARIEDGVRFLNESSDEARWAKRAFILANHAMLVAQLRSSRSVREPSMASDGRIHWEPSIPNPDPSIPDPRRGYWRAFQIAFLLMSLRGIAEPKSSSREIVDLIWFPTGGGKTEAYLGLTAFTIFFNRLAGRNSTGADVLMRYTLRLLTAQQFQRAAVLFCAMEKLRVENLELGDKAIRIGLWVGGSSSPNTREDALSALTKLTKDSGSENPFVLLKCPWCGAKFGPSSGDEPPRKGLWKKSTSNSTPIPSVLGYCKYTKSPSSPATVVFRCNDAACDFGTASPLQKARPPLPIVIIDEDLLEDPPALVIGTVDKFAMLAWKPEVRRLFGIAENGKHEGLPPSLIIQDELHLISGPLGSMVGAYETIIERLCQKDGYGRIKPKIVASTATISRARDQIKHLYAREDVFLFPPSGLEAGDSFFAREARNEDGSLKPGRLYLGILATAHGSLQTTQARVYASLMQHAAIMETDESGRDPWWTLLCFFNSIRELGGAATLFVSDTRDYLRVILDRYGLKHGVIRKLFNVSELTGRIRSDQVPKELERLERELHLQMDKTKADDNNEVVDACLASNIIEVGVDVSRLSLMAIVGQPKTTSQYIQVSSRVGRDPEKPGLVAVLYGPSKPRDRSHFERFKSYHQRLYAQVEPTSVTPFSTPAVERSLHSIVVAAVRQLGALSGESNSPDPFPLEQGTSLLELITSIVEDRVTFVAPEEHVAVMEKLQFRLRQWKTWMPGEYGGFKAAPLDPPLLHPAGSSEPPSWTGRSWATMSSLRNVDAACEAEVTGFFNQIQEDQL